MRDRIFLLENELIDKIAAGEVVQRPASVVRELIDNALDANATHIQVTIKAGGTTKIRVTDNGEGMTPSDAARSVERHATSKLRRFEELTDIQTFGFRGEALASIAAVSRFELVTRRGTDAAATRISLDGGSSVTVNTAAGAPGTSVDVSDLFFNVPARRKFLKSTATESAHISDILTRAALTSPKVKFKLVRDGRTALDLPSARDSHERTSQLFQDLKTLPIAGHRAQIQLKAFLSPPDRSRSGATGLHLFVNGRPVRDRGIARAIAFAYGDSLPPGRYPIGTAYITLPNDQVDINVDPQKREVRFSKGHDVMDAVTRVIARAIGTVPWSNHVNPEHDRRANGVRSPTRSSLSEAIHGGKGTLSRGYFGKMRCAGLAWNEFLICESEEALRFIDIVAARQLICRHRIDRERRSGEVKRQELLFPARIDFSPLEFEQFEKSAPLLNEVGIECEAAGPSSVLVRTIPSSASIQETEKMIREAVTKSTSDEIIKVISIHSDLSGVASLSSAQQDDILTQLDEIERSQTTSPSWVRQEVVRFSIPKTKLQTTPRSATKLSNTP